MKIYAITGGIASGKSTFSELIKQKQLPFVDCDALVHEAYAPGKAIFEAVVAHFGIELLNEEGLVDRKRLGQLIFNDSKARNELNEITHPIVKKLIEARLKEYERLGAQYAFVDVPLLFEGDLDKDYDGSILIDTEESLQLQRLMQRNALPEVEAKNRIATQMPLAEKRKRATYVVSNNSTVEAFISQAEALIAILTA